MLGGFLADEHLLVLIKECDHMQQSFSGESIKLVVDQVCLMELRYPMESVDVALRYASFLK